PFQLTKSFRWVALLIRNLPGLCCLFSGFQSLNPMEITTEEEDRGFLEERLPCQRISYNIIQLSFALYRKSESWLQYSNILFSPTNVIAASLMLSLGAKNNTHYQIMEGLNFTDTIEGVVALVDIGEQRVHKCFQNLFHAFLQPDYQFQMTTGISLFIDTYLKMTDNFKKLMTELYHSEAIPTNFGNSEEAKTQINKHIMKRSYGHILNVVKNLPMKTALALVSYISFDGVQNDQLQYEYTEEDEFFLDTGKVVLMPMVKRLGRFYLHEDKNMSSWVLIQHYVGNAMAIFILPDPGKMQQLVENLSYEYLNNIQGDIQRRYAYLYFPKFTISKTYDLETIMKTLGITQIFSSHADLSKVTKDAPVKLSKAVHKAVLGIEDKEPETFALSSGHPMPHVLTVTFNRPFLVIIKDKTFNVPLLIGKMTSSMKDGWMMTSFSSQGLLLLAGLCYLLPRCRKDPENDGVKQGGKSQKDAPDWSMNSIQRPGFLKGSFLSLVAVLNIMHMKLAALDPHKNILISPVSISIALAMMSLGTSGSTQTEIFQDIGFNITEISETEIYQQFENLSHIISQSDSNMEVSMGNAIFLDQSLKVKDSFLEDIKQYHETETLTTNFKDLSEASNQINKYVESKTRGKITHVFSDQESPATLALINYIFLKGKREHSLSPENTEDGDFHVNKMSTVKVPMMFQSGKVGYLHDSVIPCQLIKMKYSGNRTTFFVLPDQGQIDTVTAALNRDTIERWDNILTERHVNLYIPKISMSDTYDLEDVLAGTGITTLFSNSSDFSGITQDSPPKASKMVHKVMLQMDETSVPPVATREASLPQTSEPLTIKLNEPFIVLVFDNRTWSSLLLGKIMNPA
ncbi:corticosteroid-binding globulin, partial [Sigmodon hispidus]